MKIAEKILDSFLKKKNLYSDEAIDDFINPKFKNLNDPYDFEHMNQIVEKILKIKNKNQKIIIYGDYDVDGITGTAFLTKVFRLAGIDTDYYIASRDEDGYGVDKRNIDVFDKNGYKLIITVDTGYNSIDDIKYARSLGIDIIVTDHHELIKENETLDILYLNPKQSNTYKFKNLSGAGVALKLAQGVYKKLSLSYEILYEYIDIIMIGTIADVVPMIDENRIIIKHGLNVLKNTKIKGLSYLLNYLKLNKEKITTTDVSYYISPLINSFGRIGRAQTGVDFFIKEDDFDLYNIIEEMKYLNKKRRKIEKNIYDEAVSKIKNMNLEKTKIIFLSSSKWNPGVIGVVSSRLSIKYNLPVILVAIDKNFGKASCRSVNGISIFNVLEKAAPLLERYGGHDLAAGFLVSRENILKVKNFISDNISTKQDTELKEDICFDCYIPIEKIDSDIINLLEKLSPFGNENPHLLFKDENVTISSLKKFGVDDKHFSGIIHKNQFKIKCVAFDLKNKISDNYYNKKYDIIYYPETFINRDNIEQKQIIIKDIKEK